MFAMDYTEDHAVFEEIYYKTQLEKFKNHIKKLIIDNGDAFCWESLALFNL